MPIPFAALQEAVALTPGTAKGDRRKAAATPFVRLREPAPLTPAMRSAHHRHAEVQSCGMCTACHVEA